MRPAAACRPAASRERGRDAAPACAAVPARCHSAASRARPSPVGLRRSALACSPSPSGPWLAPCRGRRPRPGRCGARRRASRGAGVAGWSSVWRSSSRCCAGAASTSAPVPWLLLAARGGAATSPLLGVGSPPWSRGCRCGRCGRPPVGGRGGGPRPRPSAGSPGAGWRSARPTRPFTAVAAFGGAPLVTFAVALAGASLAYGRRSAASRPRPVGRCASPAAAAGGRPLGSRPAGARCRRRRAARSRSPSSRATCRGRAGLQRPARGRAAQPRRGHAGAGRRGRRGPQRAARPRASGRRTPPTSTPTATPTRRADRPGAVEAIGVPDPGRRRRATGDPATLLQRWDRLGPGDRPRRRPTSSGTRCRSASTCRSARCCRGHHAGSTWSAGLRRRHRARGPARRPGASVGDVICFEVAYDGLVARRGQRRAPSVLVVQTNNATFGYTAETAAAAGDVPAAGRRARPRGRSSPRPAGSARSIAPDGTVVAAQPAMFTAGTCSTRPVPLRDRDDRGRPLGALAGMDPRVPWVLAVASSRPRSRRRARRAAHRMANDEPQRRRRAAEPVPLGTGAGRHPDLQRGARTSSRSSTGSAPPCPRRTSWSSTTAARTAPARSPTSWPPPTTSVHVLHRAGKEGLGAAYVAGFGWALERGYDVVVEMDADGSHRPEELPRLLAALARRRPGARLAVGARRHGGQLAEVAGSSCPAAATLYTRLALGMPLRDATGGYRAYRARDPRAARPRRRRLAGLLLPGRPGLAGGRGAGFRVVEVPITFIEREPATAR